MARQKLRQHGELVAGARVVFHRAGAERIEMRVDRKILLRQAGVVAHRVHLGDFRQQRLSLAPQMGGNIVASGLGCGGLAAFLRPGRESSKISML